MAFQLPPLNLNTGGGGPADALSNVGGFGLAFDNSGWTVATGGGSATASRTQTPTAAALGGVPVSYYLVGALVAFAVWKRFLR